MIISKSRILQAYERQVRLQPNDAKRFAQVAITLGIEVKTVVDTVHEAQNDMENT